VSGLPKKKIERSIIAKPIVHSVKLIDQSCEVREHLVIEYQDYVQYLELLVLFSEYLEFLALPIEYLEFLVKPSKFLVNIYNPSAT